MNGLLMRQMQKFIARTQFALREVRCCMPNRKTLIGCFVLAAFIGLHGPFGAYETLPIYERIPYFIAMIFGTFIFPISLFNCFLHKSKAQGNSRTALIFMFGTLMIFAASSVIYWVNYLIWGENVSTPSFLECIGIVAPIGILQMFNTVFQWVTFLRPDSAKLGYQNNRLTEHAPLSNDQEQQAPESQTEIAFFQTLTSLLGH